MKLIVFSNVTPFPVKKTTLACAKDCNECPYKKAIVDFIEDISIAMDEAQTSIAKEPKD